MIWSKSLRKRAADMFERGYGYKAVSSDLGVNRETVRDWYAIWIAVGTDGLLNCHDGMRKQYSPELKLQVARERLAGKSTVEVMARHGIPSRHRVKEWTRLYKQKGAAAFGVEESEETEARQNSEGENPYSF